MVGSIGMVGEAPYKHSPFFKVQVAHEPRGIVEESSARWERRATHLDRTLAPLLQLLHLLKVLLELPLQRDRPWGPGVRGGEEEDGGG